jgi:hypothetical protein
MKSASSICGYNLIFTSVVMLVCVVEKEHVLIAEIGTPSYFWVGWLHGCVNCVGKKDIYLKIRIFSWQF